MVHDTSSLDPLVKEYDQLKRKLEDLLDDYLGRQKRLLKIKRRKVCIAYHIALPLTDNRAFCGALC